MFSNVKQARWQAIAAFVVLHGAFKILFFHTSFAEFVAPLLWMTGGVISYTFLTYLIEIGVLVAILLLGFEKLRLRDLGLERRHLVNGAIILLLFWGLKQVTIWLGTWAIGIKGASTLIPLSNLPEFWGKLAEVWLGNAFFEEVMYRGFLLPQVYFIARRWWPNDAIKPLTFSVVAVQLYFGLNHIPAGLAMGLGTLHLSGYILQVSLVGVLLAFIFLRTGNLFLAIGVHALLNFPIGFFAAPVDPSILVLAQACVLIGLWPRMYQHFGDVFTMRPALAPTWQRAD